MKTYWTALAVATVLLLFLMIPGVGLMAVLYTMGFGFLVVVPLPYVVLVLWALLPAVLLRDTLRRRPALVAAAVAVALALAAPAPLADCGAAGDLARQGDLPARPLGLPVPPSVEIRYHGEINLADYGLGSDGGPLPIESTPCDDLCERLLRGGAAWVRVVIEDDEVDVSEAMTNFDGTVGRIRFPKPITTRVRLVLGSEEDCRTANPDLRGTRCVLYAPDDGRPADLALELASTPAPRLGWRRLAPYQPRVYYAARAVLGPSEVAREVYKATRIVHGRPSFPTWIGIDLSGMSGTAPSGGLHLRRGYAATAPLDLVRDLAALGVPLGPTRPTFEPANQDPLLAPWPVRPDALDAARLASLLALGPNAAPAKAPPTATPSPSRSTATCSA